MPQLGASRRAVTDGPGLVLPGRAKSLRIGSRHKGCGRTSALSAQRADDDPGLPRLLEQRRSQCAGSHAQTRGKHDTAVRCGGARCAAASPRADHCGEPLGLNKNLATCASTSKHDGIARSDPREAAGGPKALRVFLRLKVVGTAQDSAEFARNWPSSPHKWRVSLQVGRNPRVFGRSGPHIAPELAVSVR